MTLYWITRHECLVPNFVLKFLFELAAGGYRNFKSAALEHDAEKWRPVFGKTSCSNNILQQDADSKKRHHALGAEAPRAIKCARQMPCADRTSCVICRPPAASGTSRSPAARIA